MTPTTRIGAHLAPYLAPRLSPDVSFGEALTRTCVALELEGWRSLREVRAVAPRWLRAWGDAPLAELDARIIAAWLHHEATTGAAPKTRRKWLALLRKVLDRAVLDGAIARNPVRELPRECIPPNRVRDPYRAAGEILTPRQIARVCFEPRLELGLRVLFGLQVLAGLRVGEAAGAQWGDIADARPLRRLTVSRQWSDKDRALRPTKTTLIRRVPVHPGLEDLLVEARAWYERIVGRPPLPTDLLAPCLDARAIGPVDARLRPWRASTALMRWRRASAMLELPRTRQHGLRHTFVTVLVRAGAAERLVFEMTHHLGSGTGDTPRTYLHYSWEQLCSAVKLLPVRRWSR